MNTPPRLPLYFLRWFCHPDLLEDVEGDLTELYEARAGQGHGRADWRFCLDVLLLFRPGIIRNFHNVNHSNHFSMIQNYLIASWRNLMKHKRFSAINVFSLTLGIAACMVIYLFIRDERSFDTLHSKKDHLYRLCEVQSFPGTNTQKVALNMAGMGPTMLQDFPEVQNYTRFWNYNKQVVGVGDKSYVLDNVAGVDSTFLQLFDFQLLEGDRDGIRAPTDALVTASAAQRIFGSAEQAIGNTIKLFDHLVTIRGVLADVPENSHLQFDALVSIQLIGKDRENFDAQFGSNFLNTYLLLSDAADFQDMESRYPDYLERRSGRDEINDYIKLFLQPLTEVHLGSMDIEHDYNNYRKFNGSYLNVFVLIGIFILVIATVNFMNLTTARASTRAKEVGVRKSIGALRGQVFSQFILESTMMAAFALLLALILTVACLPFLNSLVDRQLSLAMLFHDLQAIAWLLGGTVGLGLLAGLYPSFYLSSFKPVVILKGLKRGEKRSVLRSSLIVVQFSLALAMIVCTLVVVQQLLFMKNKDIGFETAHMMIVPLKNEAQSNYQKIKQALQSKPDILGVTASGQRLGNNFHQWGFKVRKDTGVIDFTPSNVLVDYNYLDVYGIRLLEGRSFSEEFATDDGLAFIVNQALADELGLANPIGTRVGHGWYPNDSLGTIIGVTENFNFNSLHFQVNTLSMVVHSDWGFSEMSVKLDGRNLAAGIREVEEVYHQFVTDYPFEYEFLDDHFDELYKSDSQLGSVITIIAVLSILIGCMGLFGLASISMERRIKEIGIRKVLGATEKDLLVLLSRNFAFLILLSFVVATPITWIYLSGWLNDFAYRIDMNPLMFLLGGIVALAIAMATISYHVLQATRSSPVKSLRYE